MLLIPPAFVLLLIIISIAATCGACVTLLLTRWYRPTFRVKRIHPDAILPVRGSIGAAGFDVCSIDDGIVPARGKAIFQTGLVFELPGDCYARVAPRSGLTWKNSIDVGAGVVDFDYSGTVGIILFNHSNDDFVVSKGDRIAQIILEAIIIANIKETTSSIKSTERGSGGFGSTGVKTLPSKPKSRRQSREISIDAFATQDIAQISQNNNEVSGNVESDPVLPVAERDMAESEQTTATQQTHDDSVDEAAVIPNGDGDGDMGVIVGNVSADIAPVDLQDGTQSTSNAALPTPTPYVVISGPVRRRLSRVSRRNV